MTSEILAALMEGDAEGNADLLGALAALGVPPGALDSVTSLLPGGSELKEGEGWSRLLVTVAYCCC